MIADDEDPILLAGSVRCMWCGREAWPVAAARLSDELVIAAFEQPHRTECRGPRKWTAIIDIIADPGQAFAHAPAGNARRARDYYRRHSCRACGVLTGARYCAACRCQAQTARGLRCANRGGPGGFCGVHPAAAAPEAVVEARPRRERRRGGKPA